MRDLLDHPQEKFGSNFMIWGGLCWKGLVPPNRPIFVDDLKDCCRAAGVPLGRGGGIDGQAYAHMITQEVIPIVKNIYSGVVKELWQDDCAAIHRCEPEYFGFVCINMRLRMATGRTSNNKGFQDCHGEVMTDDWGLTGQI